MGRSVEATTSCWLRVGPWMGKTANRASLLAAFRDSSGSSFKLLWPIPVFCSLSNWRAGGGSEEWEGDSQGQLSRDSGSQSVLPAVTLTQVPKQSQKPESHGPICTLIISGPWRMREGQVCGSIWCPPLQAQVHAPASLLELPEQHVLYTKSRRRHLCAPEPCLQEEN